MHADQTTCSLPVNMSVPQGSVFGPLGFAVYTEDVADVINQHSVLFQLFADDTRLHASSRPDDFSCLRQRLEACVADFAQWCASRHLQLNADKTETLLVGSRANMTKLATQDQSLRISSETIKPTTVVRDLDMLLDSELSMKHHVTKLAAVCH